MAPMLVVLPPNRDPIFEWADFQSKSNNKDHRSDEISHKRLIVRRGQPFKISLTFKSRSYHPNTHQINFTVETGPKPSVDSGTKTTFSLDRRCTDNGWSASIIYNDAKSVGISISSPPSAVIGRYTLKLQLVNISHNLGEFILLFNPWCQDDELFLHSEAERTEYVLNENGMVYMGTAQWITSRPWNFGQFDDDIIDICLRVLDRNVNYLQDPVRDYGRRNDPVYVSRVVSAMINSNDDDGVLSGKWTGQYCDGTNPCAWNGSVSILRQWLARGCQPVKYGQCWVFASVLCTVMRCLGVPTRVVTNFNSAHDNHGDLCIDILHDASGRLLKEDTKDSIWEFHVWNECWMERKDLPAGYGGWQALDATPQERSDGIYCCGPTSVKAIKEGDVHLKYDGPFVFAEVNADTVSWYVQAGTSEKKMFHKDTHSIGNNISTKAVGSETRVDITSNYKYEEGSKEERVTFNKAVEKRNINPSPEIHPSFSHVGVTLKIKLTEAPVIGQGIKLTLLASNATDQHKNIHVNISAQTILSDDRARCLVWQEKASARLSPKSDWGQYGSVTVSE
ncbi:protein-glutamine gamma-glutamyltransferase 5-like [Ascaphus truei]|uniref:protein-glutamine gamma-glutamyltransferase 5-like n=1 Tax=Ascaphus truei TaxID=8439 RepID=UPI003F5A1314